MDRAREVTKKTERVREYGAERAGLDLEIVLKM